MDADMDIPNIHDYIRAFYGYECRIILSEISVLLSIESLFLVSVPLAKSTASSPRRDAFVCSVYLPLRISITKKGEVAFPIRIKGGCCVIYYCINMPDFPKWTDNLTRSKTSTRNLQIFLFKSKYGFLRAAIFLSELVGGRGCQISPWIN